MAEPFARSEKPTLGVEWEVALIDPFTRDLESKAGEVLKLFTERHPDLHLEKEFLANTVELVTGVHDTVPQAISELERGIRATQAIAEELGVRVWTSGSHPFSEATTADVSQGGHYDEIIERTQFWGQQMLIWGLHVHVGISHEDRVWPIINALMTKFPHLLALSASSPAWGGRNTGYASNRTMLYQQLPTASMPYNFRDWDHWSQYMADQSKSGVINHIGSMHFDIRPASKWGTIEVRVCDSPTNLRELSALVALTHCLIVYYDRLIDKGETLPSLQHWHNAENKWRAARYGMDAIIITTRGTDECLVTEDLEVLLDVLKPISEDLGCADELQIIREIMTRGAAYQRQLRAYEDTGHWEAAVDLACAELDEYLPVNTEVPVENVDKPDLS